MTLRQLPRTIEMVRGMDGWRSTSVNISFLVCVERFYVCSPFVPSSHTAAEIMPSSPDSRSLYKVALLAVTIADEYKILFYDSDSQRASPRVELPHPPDK